MTTLRCMALISLGIAFCTGCGDSSPQAWEGKSQSSASKKGAKVNDVVNNDDDSTTDQSDDPHKMMNPHGAMNPHAGMPMAGGGADKVIENDGKLDIDTVHFTVPKAWIRKAPKPSSMVPILAEYGIPKAEGDKADGRLTVTRAGGSLESNIDRWKGQFGTDKANQETIDAGGIKITLVDLAGTFNDSMGPFAPAVERPDYRMQGAVFQLPDDTMLTFVKCYGPKKTITAHADEFKEFLKSLKVDK